MKILAITLLMLLPTLAMSADMSYGRFTNTVKVEWVRGDEGERRMRLLEDFGYIDPKGRQWLAPKGYVTDGASIPRVFWSLAGAPFDGQYREAAVIHDMYCDTKSEPWQDVHRIFYYANRAAGVSELKSKILYSAVVAGGPKWGKGPSKCFAGCHAQVTGQEQVVTAPIISESDAQRLIDWVTAKNPSLDEIDRHIQQKFRPGMPSH